MFRLPFIILLLGFLLVGNSFAQSPHGEGLKLDCSVCHNPNNWKVDIKKTNFDHSTTNFSLIGQHTVINCQSCHKELVFTEAESDCITCHKDIHQETVGLDCTKCHTPVSWMVKDIDRLHQELRFPLTGTHSSADCAQCHSRYVDLYFEPLELDCYSCHQDNYQSTSSPIHTEAGFSTDCMLCHSITSEVWAAASIIHDFFPLVGGHAIQDCFSCHQQGGDFSGLSQNCFSCHQQDYENVQDPNHLDAGFPTDCLQCHTINGWSPATFDHDITGFQLTGKHNTIDCSDCHSDGFSGTPAECIDCHQQDYETVTDPDHVSGNFPTTCEDCHSTSGWTPATFDHNQTNFPLTGSHIALDCQSCHTDGFQNTPTDCYSCHQQDYEATTDPNHIEFNFPTDCSQCHSTNEWGDATFDHNQTNFPLTGAHIVLDCQSCHADGFQNTPTDCYSCHQQDYESVLDPNHVDSGFPTDCTQCHTTAGWDGADFDHSITGFELTGAHINTDCLSCHTNGFEGTSSECFSCHESEYNNTSNPDHIAANFPTTCEDCHSTNGWAPATFDHDAQFFPIYSGEHRNKWDNCNECHTVPGDFSQFSCLDCHEHRQSKMDDEHQGVSGYIYESNACFSCHPTGKSDGAFNHNLSNFPLTGSHIGLDCLSCHQSGYNDTPFACLACHQQNYDESTNPDHQALSLSTDCETCHSTEPNWNPASFPIHDQYFMLEGSHQQITDCGGCHNGNYNNTSEQCYGCHEDNYTQAANPNHTDAGISTDCEPCHNATEWSPSIFDHTEAGFELLGQHASTQCSSCHEGTTSGLNSECFGCHETEYNSAPDHLTQNFPTNCEMCHTANNWQENSFDHSNTDFPLTGAHQNVDCNNCHENGYTGTSTVCYDCHQTNYEQTTNPDHQALSFDTNCEDCHTTNPNWEPASFPIHNQFYELIGAHANINDCNACHNGNFNSAPNTCFECHESEFNGVNDPPHLTLNFSHDCLECHNQNHWEPANFIHDFYPLSNHHTDKNCNECHSEPNYGQQCMSCHEEDFLDEHNWGDPTDCWSCHTTFNWDVPGMRKIERAN